MPSTVAVQTGLTYGGTDLQDFPRIFLELVEGGPDTSPEVRGQDSRTPYREGQTYGPKRYDRLAIMLRGWVAGEGSTEAAQREDTADARAELYSLFDVVGGVQELSVTLENGEVWVIDAYPEVFLPESYPAVPTHWGISVRLIAIDPPYWVAGFDIEAEPDEEPPSAPEDLIATPV